MESKEVLKKLWFLLWKDNSPKGWIFSIIFLFIFIKFIFFPTMSLVTGTSLPLAIVESCSMYHNGNLLSDYNQWWENHETKYLNFEIEKQDFTFKKGLNKGDILFIIGKKPEKLKLGDVIIFNANHKNPIIHRIIKINKINEKYTFSTIGDNNEGQINSEINIKSGQIVGKAIFKIAPYLGWGKLIFFEYNQRESNKGFCN
tara:strand:- start:4053 stop:4655 length:603 start_codon:yes stop_codon:yes gene_type:complete